MLNAHCAHYKIQMIKALPELFDRSGLTELFDRALGEWNISHLAFFEGCRFISYENITGNTAVSKFKNKPEKSKSQKQCSQIS